MSPLEKILQLKFTNSSLLDLALTHTSYLNERDGVWESNERLEFLGDAVLGLCVTEYLYSEFPNSSEGKLARLKSYVVSAHSLAQVARELGIGDFIKLGKGEKLTGGNQKESVLANVMESIIGGVYLEHGFQKASEFVLFLLKGQIDHYKDHVTPQDYKSKLQVYVQKKYHNLPSYQIEEIAGLSNQRIFRAWLQINETLYQGEGTNKKQAEQRAARTALVQLGELSATE